MGTAAHDAAPKTASAALVEVYNDGDEFQKMVAIWALLKVRPGIDSVVKRAIPLLTKGLAHERPNVRLECAKALGDIGPRADSALDALKKLQGDEIEMPDDDTLEPLPSEIDLISIAYETIALALPAYPRSADAALDVSTFGPPGVAPLTDEAARPFAGLAALRAKMTDESDD